MKKIQRLATLAGLSLALLALGAVGAKAQLTAGLSRPIAWGSFTLPFEAQFGSMTLPAGDYTLEYGALTPGNYLVEVVGKAEGSPRGFVLVQQHDTTAATQSSLICVREGRTGIVKSLEMSWIGESVTFSTPHGGKIMAEKRNGSTNTQLAEAGSFIQRIPVNLNGK